MKIINMSETPSVLNQYLSELRNVSIQQDKMRFRHNLERIGELMAYEMSKGLNYKTTEIQTPLSPCKCQCIADDIVLATIFRAGLPLHLGFLNVFDKAECGFVSAYRYYKDKECSEVGVHVEYMASPDLTGKTLIIVDPMLAKGYSLELAVDAFSKNGKPRRLIMASVIAAQEGVDHILKRFGNREDTELWCAVIDPVLNDRSYIVPGLGDAGDLAYGSKL
ncbi:MAG: uracil phosphoribosyltransferase [Bacteroidaceae bacterium]|nr:uracil phosphoribosyltransferase [Bacteroidaceae bacterium]